MTLSNSRHLVLLLLIVSAAGEPLSYLSYSSGDDAAQDSLCPVEQLVELCRESPGTYPADYAGICGCLSCSVLCSNTYEDNQVWCANFTSRGFCFAEQSATNDKKTNVTAVRVFDAAQQVQVHEDANKWEKVFWVVFAVVVFVSSVVVLWKLKEIKNGALKVFTHVAPTNTVNNYNTGGYVTIDQLHQNPQAEEAMDNDRPTIGTSFYEILPDTHVVVRRDISFFPSTLARLFRYAQAEAARLFHNSG